MIRPIVKELFRGFARVDLQAVVALLYTGVVLTVLEFWYLPVRIQARLQADPWVTHITLKAGAIWSVSVIIAFMVIPTLIVLFFHRASLVSVGWNLRGFLKHLLVYLGLFALMVPLLLWASVRPDFMDTYPFVGAARRDMQTFLLWELAYVSQFFALESFFRGYLLFTLEKRMGVLAVFVMAVPYCMIHYHKPPAEAFGALIAGVILGVIALRFRSWIGGAVLHALIGASMDSLAAHEAGLF